MVRFKNRWLLFSIALIDDAADASSSLPTSSSSSSSTAAAAAAVAALNAHLTSSNLVRALRTSISDHFGELGAGALAGSSLTCKYCSPSTRTAIVRCARGGCDMVRAAATLIERIGRARARVSVVHCGGTIRKVQEHAIRMDRRKILALEAEKKRRLRVAPRRSGALPVEGGGVNVVSAELGAGLEVEMELASQGGGDRQKGTAKAGAVDEEIRKMLSESKSQILAVKQ